MNDYATSGKEANEPTTKAEKRAHWEAFEFRVPTPGAVRVENTSYGDESGEHVYVVSVEGSAATECTCPADEYQPGACKHRYAVEDRPAVMLAASASDGDREQAIASVSKQESASGARAVATDGGLPEDEGETCDRCPTLLADAHAEPAGYTVVTTDGEELCPECADARSLCEQGFHADCGGHADEVSGQ